ncbi:MAG: HAD family hydrolase [Nitriliruptoraceae bacterium]
MAELLHLPEAVLFDLDGTLVDSEGLWQRAYRTWADRRGVALGSGWWDQVVGASLAGSLAALRPEPAHEDVEEEVADLVATAAALLATTGAAGPLVTWRAGARELLAALDAAGLPTAVVTSSPRVVLDAIAARLGIEVVTSVAGDEVARAKPAPDGYLAAASELEVDPAGCVVVEDSPTGVAAAEAAGMRVLAVPASVPVPAAPTRRVVASLEGVDLGVLARLPPPAAPTSR